MKAIYIVLLGAFLLNSAACVDNDKSKKPVKFDDGKIELMVLETSYENGYQADFAASFLKIDLICDETSSFYSKTNCQTISQEKCNYMPLKKLTMCNGPWKELEFQKNVYEKLSVSGAGDLERMETYFKATDKAYDENIKDFYIALLSLIESCNPEGLLYDEKACMALQYQPEVACNYKPFSLSKASCDGPYTDAELKAQYKSKMEAAGMTPTEIQKIQALP